MKNGLLLIACCLLVAGALRAGDSPAKKYSVDKVLTTKLEPLVRNFHGTAGIYVRNLKTGATVAINADTLFPTASMIKVPIMCGLFDMIEKGGLTWQQELTYRDSLLYPGEDIVGAFRDSARIALSKVATGGLL